MGSEASSSTTPILDLLKPIPSRKTSRLALLAALIFVIVAIPIGISIGWATEDWHSDGIILLLPILFVIIIIHELGHAISAWLVGFHLQGVSVGRFRSAIYLASGGSNSRESMPHRA